jgi:proline iminopeptidase
MAELPDTLYPPIKPFRTGYLQVSALHQIYYELSGNPEGKPAVFLHGGPGAATDPAHRSLFDPKRYLIVLFDQRGCGKSRPHAELRENTTWHLTADIETLRKHLGVDQWLVFGGSWGSTLALAYAEQYPEQVSELVLRGIFLLRSTEIKGLYQNPQGAGSLFPDRWADYEAQIPKRERADMVGAYYRRLTSRSRSVRAAAARAWSIWEGATSHLLMSASYLEKFEDALYAAAFARIECHYFINHGFLKRDDQLLRDVKRIRQIPAVIVQGRYDAVCPMRSAWDLHCAWPEAQLHVIPDAGHSAFEPGICAQLVAATDAFAAKRATARSRASRRR